MCMHVYVYEYEYASGSDSQQEHYINNMSVNKLKIELLLRKLGLFLRTEFFFHTLASDKTIMSRRLLPAPHSQPH